MSEMEMEWKKCRGEPRTASGVRKLRGFEQNSRDQLKEAFSNREVIERRRHHHLPVPTSGGPLKVFAFPSS